MSVSHTAVLVGNPFTAEVISSPEDSRKAFYARCLSLELPHNPLHLRPLKGFDQYKKLPTGSFPQTARRQVYADSFGHNVCFIRAGIQLLPAPTIAKVTYVNVARFRPIRELVGEVVEGKDRGCSVKRDKLKGREESVGVLYRAKRKKQVDLNITLPNFSSGMLLISKTQ